MAETGRSGESGVQAGPTRPRLTAELREKRKAVLLVAVRRAIWEASQLVPLAELERYALGTIQEIRDDEP